MKAHFCNIDGAVVFPEVETNINAFEETEYKVPSKPNSDYKYLMVTDDYWVFASKDKKNWCIAIMVIINGEPYYAKIISEAAKNMVEKTGYEYWIDIDVSEVIYES